jgi:hypothetical protein
VPDQSRNRTKHIGVFLLNFTVLTIHYSIRYKKDRKLIEERAERETQGWTAAKTNHIRTERLTRKSESNVEKRVRGMPCVM